MKWNILTTEEELDYLLKKSNTKPQLIFKHSTRCSVSSVVRKRLESAEAPEHIDFHFLDLLAHRSLSNKIAEGLKVYHESPQVLLLQNGECIYDESHMAIRMNDILNEVV